MRRKGFCMVFLIILIVLILLYVFLLIPRLPRRDMSALTKVDYAHRGLWNAQRPENSLSAFRSAVDAGYGIELDVHRTKDGVLVVHHDDNLKRVCGVDRRIAQSTLAEVRACHLSGTDEVVPTFDEVLEAVGGRVPLIVELKVEQNVDSLCSAVRERMQHYNGLWCMESFDPRCLMWLRAFRPEIIRGQLSENFRKDAQGWEHFVGFLLSNLLFNAFTAPDFIAYKFEDRRRFAPRICRAFYGAHMFYWTVRTYEDLKAAEREGAQAIFEGFDPDGAERKSERKEDTP